MRPSGRLSSCGRRSALGFILIYALWILAACSVVLAALVNGGVQSAKINEKLLLEAVEFEEALNVLNYVLAHTAVQTQQVDPRFIEYQREAITQADQANSGIVRELQDILSQIGMEIDLEDAARSSIEIVEEPEKVLLSEQSATIRQRSLFGVADKPFKIKPGEIDYEITIRPANALPNLNILPRKALLRYLVYLGLDQAAATRLAGVIQDWVDEDDFLTDAGGESMQYAVRRGPRNEPIKSWGEVFYLKGATAQLVEFLRRHFILHSELRRVHAGYLTPEALAALTDIPLQAVAAALENKAAEQMDDYQPLDEVLLDEHARKFLSLVAWDTDNQVLIIEIVGSTVVLSVVFDVKTQQVLDWYTGERSGAPNNDENNIHGLQDVTSSL